MKVTNQTLTSFKNKWDKNQSLAFAETQREGSEIFNWVLNRNGLSSVNDLREWLSKKTSILDAGCGNGRITALLSKYSQPSAVITGIDLTSSDVAKKNLVDYKNIKIAKKDLLENLSDLGNFDLIYCQEVLHHTSDPKAAFLNLCKLLKKHGEIAIYVYKQKAPMREYADDYVRDRVSDLEYEEAIDVMKGITELGKILSELDVKINVPEIKVLGIKSGEYDIQRFIYNYFLKCFWNNSLDYNENVAINYDWYHPQLCTRHTLEEIINWYDDAELEIIHSCVDDYGITVRGIKQ